MKLLLFSFLFLSMAALVVAVSLPAVPETPGAPPVAAADAQTLPAAADTSVPASDASAGGGGAGGGLGGAAVLPGTDIPAPDVPGQAAPQPATTMTPPAAPQEVSDGVTPGLPPSEAVVQGQRLSFVPLLIVIVVLIAAGAFFWYRRSRA